MSDPAVHHPTERPPSYWTWTGKLVIPDSIYLRLMTHPDSSVYAVELAIESALAEWAGIKEWREQEEARKSEKKADVGGVRE